MRHALCHRLPRERRRTRIALCGGALVCALLAVGCGKSEPVAKPDKWGMTDPTGGKPPEGVAHDPPEAAREDAAMAVDEQAADEQAAARKAILDKVVGLYSMVGDQPVDVIEATPAHGLLRVTFASRGGNERQSTVFVSEAGDVVFERGYEIDHELESLAVDKLFADCLSGAGLKVHGHPGQPATRAQLKVIGRFGERFLQPCKDKAACDAAAKTLGVKKLPALTVRGANYNGPRTRVWLETLTGCK